ncbi:ester cyclase [Sphingomonas canadensis]|uniref:Ester cyclase n=1 Tax=Sphingomonas canadensis TaxID=1219257 RepID=A0ABW3HAT2_9SPHN|nr:ester cyclase [Sphingomonas canadensis]MCW3838145.1 ester cyclase [Sphingomonas canadensis]
MSAVDLADGPGVARRTWLMGAAGLGLAAAGPAVSGGQMQDVDDEDARRVVNRLIREVQTGGDFQVFEELFHPEFVDHTPFPGYPPTKEGARRIYATFRNGFPDFRAEVHLQVVEQGRVTSFKTYRGTHQGPFLGLKPSGKTVAFPIMDIVEVRRGRITAHWGVPHVWDLMQQLGVRSFDEVKG